LNGAARDRRRHEIAPAESEKAANPKDHLDQKGAGIPSGNSFTAIPF